MIYHVVNIFGGILPCKNHLYLIVSTNYGTVLLISTYLTTSRYHTSCKHLLVNSDCYFKGLSSTFRAIGMLIALLCNLYGGD